MSSPLCPFLRMTRSSIPQLNRKRSWHRFPPVPQPRYARLSRVRSAQRTCFEPIAASFLYRGTDYKFSIRLDHAWNASNQFMFRYNAAIIDESNPNTRALLGATRATDTSRLDHTGILRWQRTFSSRSINEFQFQYNYDNYLVKSVEQIRPGNQHQRVWILQRRRIPSEPAVMAKTTNLRQDQPEPRRASTEDRRRPAHSQDLR